MIADIYDPKSYIILTAHSLHLRLQQSSDLTNPNLKEYVTETRWVRLLTEKGD